ncbi:PGPGW domain-containing protein [Aeromicrobium sp.]|nr:PGPGW domain-containing protein [Candidatus Saccharibacteria bacterium]
MVAIKKHAERVAIEGLGWLLVLVGIAALVLPGPGLLALFAGMALLATQYDWAERRLDPVRKAAFKTAADGVKTLPRIIMSVLFSIGLMAFGVVWGIHPTTPSWWPIADKWWLIGGWGTGGTLIGSGLIALGMIIYSYKTFRPQTNIKTKH